MSFLRQVLAALALTGVCGLGLAAQSPKSQWDGVYTDAQAARGEPFYRENCSMCHGLNLAGTVLAPALAGPAFAGKWNRRPLATVFDIMRTQMPLNLSGHLSDQQNADVLAYMLQVGGMPAGASELPGRVEVLKAITIIERKP
ncbi:MAG: cytochrome c [Vicinamibacterales bacterium]